MTYVGAISADDSYVYWCDEGGLMFGPPDSGTYPARLVATRVDGSAVHFPLERHLQSSSRCRARV